MSGGLYMANLFGGGNEGGDSTMMIVLIGALMICCSSSSVLGYGWYENWFCQFNENLGRACTSASVETDPPGDVETDPPTGDAAGDTAGGAGDTSGDASGDTSGNSGSGGDGKKKDASGTTAKECKKATLELAYFPHLTQYSGKGKATIIDSKGKKSQKNVPKGFVDACNSQYYCYVDSGKTLPKGTYMSDTKGTLVWKTSKMYPLTSNGKDELKVDAVGVSDEMEKWKKIKIKGKQYTVADTLGVKGCKISLYTGDKKKPSGAYKGLNNGDEYDVAKA